ncbi:UNVERIFIED_CONTAM: hypothetical protein FKN15_006295 [Acipenser sinensis]
MFPKISGSRMNFLEDRLSNQDRTTAALLEQAFRIKEDLITNLRGTQGTYQAETAARTLLENHIQSITNIVKQLSADIEEMTEKKMQDSMNLLTVRLEKCEERQEIEIRANRAKHAEDKLTARIGRVEKRIWEELELMKSEYRSGFQSIHDAISSLRQINETNNRMQKEKVQKDIKQIRRKMVELKDV